MVLTFLNGRGFSGGSLIFFSFPSSPPLPSRHFSLNEGFALYNHGFLPSSCCRESGGPVTVTSGSIVEEVEEPNGFEFDEFDRPETPTVATPAAKSGPAAARAAASGRKVSISSARSVDSMPSLPASKTPKKAKEPKKKSSSLYNAPTALHNAANSRSTLPSSFSHSAAVDADVGEVYAWAGAKGLQATKIVDKKKKGKRKKKYTENQEVVNKMKELLKALDQHEEEEEESKKSHNIGPKSSPPTDQSSGKTHSEKVLDDDRQWSNINPVREGVVVQNMKYIIFLLY